MTTLLPQDANNNPIPALRPRNGGAHTVQAGTISARNAIAFDPQTKVASLYATGDIFIRLGGANVEASASDHFFPAHTYYDIALGNASHLATIAVSNTCTLYISEKE